VHLFCCSVNKQPRDQARRQALWCAWLVDLALLGFLILSFWPFWRFGGFGAKLGTFKSSKLYNVIAM
jgi:hypothetical protein